MKKYINAEKLKAEIERRFSEYNHDSNHHIQAAECASILDFLDTLDFLHQEQPVLSDNLDDAAEKYGREYVILPDDYNDGDIDFYAEETGKAFKAGAEWMERQMKKEQTEVDLEKFTEKIKTFR